MAKKKNEVPVSEQIIEIIENSIKKQGKKEDFKKKFGGLIKQYINEWKK